MKNYSWVITNRSITVTDEEGVAHTVLKNDGNYNELLSAIKEKRTEDIAALLTPAAVLEMKSEGNVYVIDSQVYVKTEDGDFAVPSGLNNTILDYMSEDLPFQPLVKFAINLSKNPSAHSVEQLFNFLEKNSFTITEEGNFIGYKSVRADFTDCHTGTFDNSVGKTVSMPRQGVVHDPEQTCSAGLHVANYSYAMGFSGAVKVFVEVNPRDVVSVPVDYNHSKMRVCEYKVLGICEEEIKERLYAPDTQEEFDYDGEDDYDKENDLLAEELEEGTCPSCFSEDVDGCAFCPHCGEALI